MLAVLASMGGFIFGVRDLAITYSRYLAHTLCLQYDTGQISDILLMDDFLQRFAQCTDRADVSTCHFSNVRAGLIVALLSVGTLIGALLGAWWVFGN